MYPEFVDKIQLLYEQDMVSQKHYISVLGDMVRNLPFDVFVKYKSFFVPNDDYLRGFWGEDCAALGYDIYGYDGKCNLNNCIVFPCLLLNGNAVGWVSFNPFVKMSAQETGDYGESYYSFPSKQVFDKGNYLFVLPEVYKKAIRDGYIIVTDGIFDAVNLTYHELNACSLLGSYLNEKSVFLLQFVKKIYVSIDNDEAGLRMLDSVRKFIPNACSIKQGISKDIDDALKTGQSKKLVDSILRCIEYGMDVRFK